MIRLGVDIEDIDRFKDKSQEFLDRVFTKSEQEYSMSFRHPESHLTARFCAKEAVIKALSGYGIKDVQLSEIEVYHDENKCPQIRILKDLKIDIDFQLSLSHDKTKSIAFIACLTDFREVSDPHPPFGHPLPEVEGKDKS